MNLKYAVWIYALSLLIAGCAAPEIRMQQEAQRLGLNRSTIEGLNFRHVVFRNSVPVGNAALHVYLDGDGTPWLNRYRMADNPTPRDPLVLRLMAMDARASVYLGRPCYLGLSATPPCTPKYWTMERYSPAVVDSMAAALTKLHQALRAEKIVLIGFSGGGGLAMLLAERLTTAAAIVTLAGNLDHAAWTRLHNYSPLTGSENPATHPPLPPHIFQLHVAGGKDANVPPELIRAALHNQPSARILVVPDADHNCCWEKYWPEILAKIKD